MTTCNYQCHTRRDAKLHHLLITDHDRITVEVHVIGQWDMRMG
jgi:hypothetical protein